MFLTDEQVKLLEDRAREVRISIIEMLAEAKSGHTGGPLGMADIFTALYFNILKHFSRPLISFHIFIIK